MVDIKRCKWCNPKNALYIEYHDKEWGVPDFSDEHLYEMLLLESFQAGLSWECVLNKRAAFTLQAIGFLQSGIFERRQEKLLETLQPEDKRIMEIRLRLKAQEQITPDEFIQYSETLLNWASGWIGKKEVNKHEIQ